MKILVQYQIEVAICMAAFGLIYLLLWRKETNFNFKRILFLGIPFFSLIIPLININIDFNTEQESAPIQYITYLPNQLEMVYAPIIAETDTISGWDIAFWVIALGVLLMFVRLLLSYIRIMQIYRQSIPDPVGKFRIVDDPIQSFSFFNMIMINRSQAQSNECDYIIEHELAHNRQGHSWDILWLEIIKMFHWFNPMIWLLTIESKKNLEYLADHEVAKETGNPKHYQYAIVQHASQGGYQLLKTQFSKTNLKKRIIMMNQPTNRSIATWKFIALVPVFIMLLMSFSIKVVNLDIKKELSEVLPEFSKNPVTEEKIYELAEVGPLPDGKRMKYFYEGLYKHIEKTTATSKEDILGSATVHFIVEKDGSLENIRILKGIKPEIDQEILRFIKEGPAWTPGLEAGEPVHVRMVLPVQFGGKTDTPKSKRKISGKLVNEQDFSAIVGAKVTVKGSQIQTETDEAGMFLVEVKPDQDELEILVDNQRIHSIELSPNHNFYRHLVRLDHSIKNSSQLDTLKQVFTIVEDQPKPSMRSMTSYYEELNKSLRYPEGAKENGIDGRVFVQFIVKSDGSLDEVKAVKGIGYGCDEEAVRLIKEGPSWVAGRQRGRAVNVRMILPIQFIGPNKIAGRVMTEENISIAGANVIIKGTSTGTVTNSNGNFTLKVDENHKEIVVAHVGYLPQTKSITPGNRYTIHLKIDPENPPDPPASIREFNEDLFNIKFREKDKLSTPIFFVNGIEVENMQTVNPNDIKSIEVLKDGYAVEKYGEKAADGVVLVTLKDGITFKPPKVDGNIDFDKNPPLIIVDGVETDYTMEELEEKHPTKTIDKIQILKDTANTNKYGEKGKNGVILIRTQSYIDKIKSLTSQLDEIPEYGEGMDAFYGFIQQKIKYPFEARKHNVQGNVRISFTITKEGNLVDIEAEEAEYLVLNEIVVVGYSKSKEEPSNLKNIPVLVEEVTRVLKQMDNFIPGMKDGQPVDVRMTLPVMFKLG
jgi:TonB family protein